MPATSTLGLASGAVDVNPISPLDLSDFRKKSLASQLSLDQYTSASELHSSQPFEAGVLPTVPIFLTENLKSPSHIHSPLSNEEDPVGEISSLMDPLPLLASLLEEFQAMSQVPGISL
jgi:hypothetical protein